MGKSFGEIWVESILRELQAPEWNRDYHFYPGRDWMMDFAWPHLHVFLEYEGKGHSKWNRYHGDVEKYNAAALDGWILYRITFKMLDDGSALKHMKDFVLFLQSRVREKTAS